MRYTQTLFALLPLLLCGGCLSLTSLQSGRTTGKDNFNAIISGTYGHTLEVPPIDGSTSNEFLVMGIDAQAGLTDKTDLVVHLDMATYLGIGLKRQLIGNLDSRFAGSIGAEIGLNTGYLITGSRNYYFTVPLYTSYELAENFMLCLSPRFLYQDGKYGNSPFRRLENSHQSHARLGMSWGFLWGRKAKFGLEVSSFGGPFFQPSQISTGLILDFNNGRDKKVRR